MIDNFTQYQRGAAYSPEAQRGGGVYPFFVQSWGTLMISLSSLKRHPQFENAIRRDELLAKLREVPGLIATEKARDGHPQIPLSELADRPVLEKVLGILRWIVALLKR